MAKICTVYHTSKQNFDLKHAHRNRKSNVGTNNKKKLRGKLLCREKSSSCHLHLSDYIRHAAQFDAQIRELMCLMLCTV